MAGALGADLLVAERLPVEEGWPALLGGAVVTREPSPVLINPGGWQEWLAGRSSNFRQQVRRYERRLVQRHGLSMRLTEDEAALEADFGVLVELHRARWRSVGVDAFAGPREAFHREVARRALGRGRLRLWIAELDGRPAAAWYGLRFGGIEWYYQAGRDPELDATSVGFVLMAHTVREALDDGMTEYRLLRGGEEYKRRFASHDEGLEIATVAHGPAGRAASGALRAAGAMSPAARARVRALAAQRPSAAS